MKRKEMEKVIRVEDYERKMRLARADKKYIRFWFYKFILFIINLFDDVNKVINGFNYKCEWEKQNVQLDLQKKRIADLEKQRDELIDDREILIEKNNNLHKELAAEKQTTKNLRKRIREIKKK